MPSRLKRSEGLGLFATIAFSVGSMIGAGVFVLSGVIIGTAGPGAVLSYILCGLLVLLSGISYASLASIFPGDGGGYLYSKTMLGGIPGFITGWGMYYFATVANAFVLLGFGIYFNLLAGSDIDPRALALMALVGLTLLNMRGLSEAGRTEVALVATKIAILILVAIVGLLHVRGEDFVPLTPSGTEGVIQGMVLVFFAYTGFQVASMMAGEVKESSRNVPLAILLSIAIVIILYTLVIVALLSANLPSYDSESVFQASVVLMGATGGALVAFAATISTLSSANAGIVGSSRVIMRMASEGQMPGRFARLRRGQPANSILLGSIIGSLFILYGDLSFIADVTNVAVLSAMFLVNLSALRLWRRKEVVADRKYFRIPLGPVIPVLGAVSCLVMIFFLPPITVILGLATLLAGTLFYFLEDTPKGRRAVEEIRRELRIAEGRPPRDT